MKRRRSMPELGGSAMSSTLSCAQARSQAGPAPRLRMFQPSLAYRELRPGQPFGLAWRRVAVSRRLSRRSPAGAKADLESDPDAESHLTLVWLGAGDLGITSKR